MKKIVLIVVAAMAMVAMFATLAIAGGPANGQVVPVKGVYVELPVNQANKIMSQADVVNYYRPSGVTTDGAVVYTGYNYGQSIIPSHKDYRGKLLVEYGRGKSLNYFVLDKKGGTVYLIVDPLRDVPPQG